MIWSRLADLLVVLHFGFAAFVVGGGFLTWRWPRLAYLHLPALAWGIWVEVSASICPLTPLENDLRSRAGEARYAGGFLAHYLDRILYPASLTAHLQWVLAALLVALNLWAYAGLWKRAAGR